MADLTDGFNKANDAAKELEKTTANIADNAERTARANSGGGGAPTMTRSTMSSFASAGTNPNGQAFGGGQGQFGNQGYSAFGTSPSNVSGAPRMQTQEDRDRYKGIMEKAGFSLAKGALAAAAFMPTTQEAVLSQQLSERLRFYGGARDLKDAYQIQGEMSSIGTSIGPLDAALASNAGAGMGLLPGLKNFRTTQTQGKTPTGILGSAALVSNLVPGSGLQGGMGAVGALNQASSVNMLRMFGIQVRNADGTQMNDVASVIDQLYKILSNGKSDLTEEDIAVSAMSGNALDSILRQYFGGDENLRQAVLAGMIQKVKGKSLAKSDLLTSGGLSKGTMSTGNRASAELKLIQTFTEPVTQGLIGANQVLQGTYAGLGKGGGSRIIQDLIAGSAGLETIAGARGGAGALAVDAIAGSFGGGQRSGRGSRTGGLAGGAAAAFGIGLAGEAAMRTDPTGLGGFGAPAIGSSSPGQVFNGGITINVSAPPSADPAAFASSISQILTGLT
jgi:hypothetical protein